MNKNTRASIRLAFSVALLALLCLPLCSNAQAKGDTLKTVSLAPKGQGTVSANSLTEIEQPKGLTSLAPKRAANPLEKGEFSVETTGSQFRGVDTADPNFDYKVAATYPPYGKYIIYLLSVVLLVGGTIAIWNQRYPKSNEAKLITSSQKSFMLINDPTPIFRVFFEMASIDGEINLEEKKVLDGISKVIGFTQNHMTTMLMMPKETADINLNVLDTLSLNQKEWFSITLLYLIFADGKMNEKESTFLDEIFTANGVSHDKAISSFNKANKVVAKYSS